MKESATKGEAEVNQLMREREEEVIAGRETVVVNEFGLRKGEAGGGYSRTGETLQFKQHHQNLIRSVSFERGEVR